MRYHISMLPSYIFIVSVVVALNLAFLQNTEGKPQNAVLDADMDDDYDYLNDNDESYEDDDDLFPDIYFDNEDAANPVIKPNFVSSGETFTVDKGTTIRLPCYLDRFPNPSYTIMWKKVPGDKILAVGKNIMDSRITVELNHEDNQDTTGSTLFIGVAEDSDAGQYVCTVTYDKAMEIKHTVVIRAQPQIVEYEPSNGLLKATKGDTVTMICRGEGNPTPSITWTRRGKLLPDGNKKVTATELTFTSVTRKHRGVYECEANNGFGKTDKETIELEVEYPPEVEVEEMFVHATTGTTVELVCNVHAHPTAVVKWFKNSMELTDETTKLNKNKHRFTLTLPDVSESDIGNYTCRAENRLGDSSSIVEVSGKATVASFTSHPYGKEPNAFLIEWTSTSYTPITQFELRYKEVNEGNWHHVDVTPYRQNSMTYAGKHSMSELRAAANYEVTVAAKNDKGWNRHSPIFNFATFGADDEFPDQELLGREEPLKTSSSPHNARPQGYFGLLLLSLLAIVSSGLLRWQQQ